MIRILALFLFVTFIFCPPAYSHSLEALKVNESATKVILRDSATGNEWQAEEGDVIDGYRVVKITPGYVTIAYTGKDGKFFVTKITLKKVHRIIKERP
jgi:hypothetical protein